MVRRKTSAVSPEIAELRGRLAAADETLRAIRAGEVDTVVVAGRRGPRVFTLEGAEHAYRMLIESMNEGALTLTSEKTILFANRSFAAMVHCALEQVTGTSFRRFISAADRTVLKAHMKRGGNAGSKIQMELRACDGSRVPVQISIRPLTRSGPGHSTIGMVVTDLTAARRSEEMLRALAQRVVQVQESERARVALELHDHVTQPLCGAGLRSQALARSLPAGCGPARKEARELCEMLGRASAEVERISRNLRPGVLEQLGLVSVLRSAGAEFANRTGVPVEVTCVVLTSRLPPDTELALYRVLQEALRNVEKHAGARHVTVELSQPLSFVHLSITDDGVGFDTARRATRRRPARGLGLLSMGERAAYVGGALNVESTRGKGTTIRAQIPFGGVSARGSGAV